MTDLYIHGSIRISIQDYHILLFWLFTIVNIVDDKIIYQRNYLPFEHTVECKTIAFRFVTFDVELNDLHTCEVRLINSVFCVFWQCLCSHGPTFCGSTLQCSPQHVTHLTLIISMPVCQDGWWLRRLLTRLGVLP